MLITPLWTPPSSPRPTLTNCTSILLPILLKVCVSDPVVGPCLVRCIRPSPSSSSPWLPHPLPGSLSGQCQAMLGANVQICLWQFMAGSVSGAMLTPPFFQNLQTLERRHDRSLPASHVNSFRNSRPMCTMNCYGGPTIRQRTKVRQSDPPLLTLSDCSSPLFLPNTFSPFFARPRGFPS